FLLRGDAVGDRAQLGQVAGRIRSQEQGFEAVAANVGAGALVIDHVARRHAEIAVQVGGSLVDRDPEGGHQVATVDLAVPEQPELDELESALDAPPDAACHCPHLRTPVARSASKRDSTSFWVACKERRAGADVDHHREGEGSGAVSGAWYFLWY